MTNGSKVRRQGAAARAASDRPLRWAARAGLTARGAVWIVIGILAVLLALGSQSNSADQKGALEELLAQPYGPVLVILMAVGFACYAIWRLSEVAFGVTGEPDGTGPRVQSLARGLVYLVLAGTAVSALLGSRSSQSAQQQSMVGRVLAHTGGRWLVALVGLVIIGVGVMLVIEGWKLAFMRRLGPVPARIRRPVRELGRIGTIGRGAVFALVGALLGYAAWTLDPKQAGGLDGALRTLLHQPFGTGLGLVAALALLAFGVYGLAEARYRRV
jgi:hypothetical protein